MKKKTSKLKSKNAFNTPVFVVILVSLVIGYLYGQFKPFNKTGKRLLYDPVQNMEYESCPSSGQIPITEFLEVYTVKKGDTLLSIAKNELNDTSRASEIVALNKYLDRFPQLSLTNPFLEVGWKLYLPFEHASQTGGNIQAYAGNITGIDQGVFRISFQQGGGGSITPSTQTQFLLK